MTGGVRRRTMPYVTLRNSYGIVRPSYDSLRHCKPGRPAFYPKCRTYDNSRTPSYGAVTSPYEILMRTTMAYDIMTYASPKTTYAYYTAPIRGLTPENKAHLLVAIKPTCSHANVRIVRLRTYGVRSRKAPYGLDGARASSSRRACMRL